MKNINKYSQTLRTFMHALFKFELFSLHYHFEISITILICRNFAAEIPNQPQLYGLSPDTRFVNVLFHHV